MNDCGSCRNSHLMRCGKRGDNFGKCTLLILDNKDECFEQRYLVQDEYSIYIRETENGYQETETREYYDMTGYGDVVYQIGILEKKKK